MPAHLVSISPAVTWYTTHSSGQARQAAGASLGSRCIGRSTGTGHELPRSLFLSISLGNRPPNPSSFVLLRPLRIGSRDATTCLCLCLCLLLVPSQTSQNTSYHLIHFCLVPCASLKCLTTAILPRPCQYKSFLPCFFSPVLLLFPFPPFKTKPPIEPTDRPTDRRPARTYLQDHGMRADGGFCVRRPAVSTRRLSR